MNRDLRNRIARAERENHFPNSLIAYRNAQHKGENMPIVVDTTAT